MGRSDTWKRGRRLEGGERGRQGDLKRPSHIWRKTIRWSDRQADLGALMFGCMLGCKRGGTRKNSLFSREGALMFWLVGREDAGPNCVEGAK